MVVGDNIQPVFKQLGIYEDLVAIGKLVTHITTFRQDLSLFMESDYSERQKMYVEIRNLFSRFFFNVGVKLTHLCPTCPQGRLHRVCGSKTGLVRYSLAPSAQGKHPHGQKGSLASAERRGCHDQMC